jgi:hypothetical protein
MARPKTPVWLHPATLRWIADFACVEGSKYERFKFNITNEEGRKLYQQRKYALDSLSRSLRNRATRIENETARRFSNPDGVET